MGDLKGLSLEFEEIMEGWLGKGETDCVNGRISGKQSKTRLQFDVKVIIDDLEKFFNVSNHNARIEGKVTYKPLGGSFEIEDGVFNLFSVHRVEGIRHMTYSFRFTASNGERYYLNGYKKIEDDPGFDLCGDVTTLFTKIYKGQDEEGPIYGAGQLFFDLWKTPALLASMKVKGTMNPLRKLKAMYAFVDFAGRTIRGEYLRYVNPFYDTEYENLVLAGKVTETDTERQFFMVSGVHDEDFPWGDGEGVWDVLLAIGDSDNGYRKFCITDRVLDGLKLDVKNGGYHYKGPIFELTDSYSVSSSVMREKSDDLLRCKAEFDIKFTASEHELTQLPFSIANDMIEKLEDTGIKSVIRSVLASVVIPGISITPYTVTGATGKLSIIKDAQKTEYNVVTNKTFGEAESSRLRNIKEPKLLYGYICGVLPKARLTRVQIHSNSLRNDRQLLVKDQIDAFLGAIISRVASKEILLKDGTSPQVRDLYLKNRAGSNSVPLFIKFGEPIIEVNNDHFPTKAVFQRRIIEVEDPSGKRCLALEENMNLMRLDAENSTQKTIVASIQNVDKIKALDAVLEKTNFQDIVNTKWNESGRSKDEFSIVIKPNFMLAYNNADHTTFTDPELVVHLVKRLKKEGYEKISVVEAQSTYGEYFTNRGVHEVAKYLGYMIDGSDGYDVVDLTEDQFEEQNLGFHLGQHRVPLTWKNADFRISFAKNKTHAYAYYTLTLKNIYGALPLADKFSEYHNKRDIYYTTMEYLKMFPVHYGLIDAYQSADGPFGIFADPEPNNTATIIGGDNLVAVDWVGASKMGIDPKISKYMELAVETFGKPEIDLKGNPNRYQPWLNVPAALSLFAHYGIDANDYFGNLIYMVGAYIDENQFQHKSKSKFVELARTLIEPLQEAFFLQAGGEQTYANRLVSKFQTWLGSQ